MRSSPSSSRGVSRRGPRERSGYGSDNFARVLRAYNGAFDLLGGATLARNAYPYALSRIPRVGHRALSLEYGVDFPHSPASIAPSVVQVWHPRARGRRTGR